MVNIVKYELLSKDELAVRISKQDNNYLLIFNTNIMKYAIIFESGDNKYITGFTNDPNKELKECIIPNSSRYLVELKELDSIFIALEGDAKIYLS